MSAALALLTVLAQICVTQQAKLVASDGLTGDLFGVSVDLLQDRIVVGAPNNRPLAVGTQTGAAYVFELVGGVWQEQAQLAPSYAIPKSYFGHAVACDAARVIVGAPMVKPTSVPGVRGLAYVYSKPTGTWVEEALLDPADPTVNIFGASVDIEGDTLLVGASGGSLGGAAFVYVRTGVTWTKQAKLVASDASSGAEFGHAVVLRGDTAVVGAYRANGAEQGSGAAYVFRRTGATWTETQKLSAPNGRALDGFGLSVALSPNTLVVGAPFVDTSAFGSWQEHGSAYVFEWNGSKWLHKQQLVPKGYCPLEHFGWSVVVEGGTLAVGAPDQQSRPGFVQFDSHSGASWIQHVKVAAQDGYSGLSNGSSGRLGSDLALDGARLAAGASQAEGGIYPSSGAVYVFDVQMQNPPPTFYCSAKQDSKGCLPRFFHEGLASVSGALKGLDYTIRAWDVQPKVAGMLFYSLAGAANAPFAGGLLCLQQPARATQLAPTSASSLPPPCNGSFSYDFNAWIAGGSDPALVAGQSLWMQMWYRDPSGLPGVNIGLTDGIFAVICP